MKTIESTYIKILSSAIELFHTGLNNIDPKQINKAKFFTRALFIVHFYATNRIDNGKRILMCDVYQYMNNRFGLNNLFSQLINIAGAKLLNIFDTAEIPISKMPIGTLYENLLNIETTGLEVKTGKEFRNKLGSYYTPQDYAYGITKIALQNYLAHNSKECILSARIADFSCGCGIFLLSALSYLKDRGLTNKELKITISNLYACDVDPIALEIAKISVLDYCNANDEYDSLNKNFHHANFLIHSTTERSVAEKLSAAMEGYIYHEALAIGVSFLQEYDLILGNPPWEKIRFEEKKFYSQYTKQIGHINFKFNLSSSIEEAHKSNQYIREYAHSYKEQLEQAKKQIKQSKFFKDSTNGELNTCTLFSDAAYKLLSKQGYAGLFVKSSLVTAKINSILFSKILSRIIAVYDFINRNKIFEIDSRERFAIIVMGHRTTTKIHLGMNLLSLAEIDNRCEWVSTNTFEMLNPETKMIPNLNSGKDIKILAKLYNKFSIFSKVYPNIKYGRLVHLTNHINDIDLEPSTDNIPIFEGKFFSLFDNAYSGFNHVTLADRYKSKAASKKLSDIEKSKGVKPLCRFFIKKNKWDNLSKDFNSEYMVAWHSLTSATNIRTCVATLLPFMPGAQSVQFLITPKWEDMIYFTGIFNSVIFDYIIKCKLNGIDLTQTIINQIPFPSQKQAEQIQFSFNDNHINAWDMIQNIVCAFYKNDDTIQNIFKGKKNNELGLKKRSSLFILLDVVVAHLYGITKQELEYILLLFDGFYSLQERESVLDKYDTFSTIDYTV